jgi:hypothetical protein
MDSKESEKAPSKGGIRRREDCRGRPPNSRRKNGRKRPPDFLSDINLPYPPAPEGAYRPSGLPFFEGRKEG